MTGASAVVVPPAEARAGPGQPVASAVVVAVVPRGIVPSRPTRLISPWRNAGGLEVAARPGLGVGMAVIEPRDGSRCHECLLFRLLLAAADIALVVEPDIHGLAVLLGGAVPDAVAVELEAGDLLEPVTADARLGLALGEAVVPLRGLRRVRVRGRDGLVVVARGSRRAVRAGVVPVPAVPVVAAPVVAAPVVAVPVVPGAVAAVPPVVPAAPVRGAVVAGMVVLLWLGGVVCAAATPRLSAAAPAPIASAFMVTFLICCRPERRRDRARVYPGRVGRARLRPPTAHPLTESTMEIRNLGSSGLRVSAIGLGCNNFGARIDKAATAAVLDAAFEHGITLFDTADVYGERGGSETVMGELLGDRRKQIVLATKFGMPMDDSGAMQGGSRRYIMQAVEDSLRRLRTDWIDLYQLHTRDPLTPIEETLRALDDLIRQGKVRYVGCSNVPAWEMAEAQWTAKVEHLNAFVSCQDEYSLVVRGIEKDVMPAARKYGWACCPISRSRAGCSTGKYKRNAPMPEDARLTKTQRLADRYVTDRNWPIVEKLGDFAEKRGRTMLELAFSWLLAQAPVSSVIAGATKPEQIAQNVKAGDWKLTAEELQEIDTITAG